MNIKTDKFRMYVIEGELWLEVWGASTKYPDVTFHFTQYHNEKGGFNDQYHRCFQFVMWCYSQLAYPVNPTEWVDFATLAQKACTPEQSDWIDRWFK